MVRNILHCALRCGAFEKHISLEPFRERVSNENAVAALSVAKNASGLFMLRITDTETRLVVLSRHVSTLDPFRGESVTENQAGIAYYALECPTDHHNAMAVRAALPRTGPRPIEARRSFGCGDRIGGISPATPWHIEACSRYGISPALAQQSVRENHKTGRTFESVLDDATWSVLETGYREPWGADADHLKTMEEIEASVKTGYTFFTLDPSDMIDYAADTDTDEVLKGKIGKLFPKEKEIDDFIGRYEGREGADSLSIVRSCVKFIPAVRHAAKAYHLIADLKGQESFNFEMSIDETATPTTPLDHLIIVSELMADGVELFSLAPRFEGRFEKGIDYIGTEEGFRRSLERHAELSRELGNYRLSLHSGSDKFSVYPLFGELTDGFFHVKTAGTSFIEAMKVVARADFEFFREILGLAIETFEENAASYDISGSVSRVPDPSGLTPDTAVAEITGNNDMRQALHIAFGRIITAHGDRLRSLLRKHREDYRSYLTAHIGRHLALLTGESG